MNDYSLLIILALVKSVGDIFNFLRTYFSYMFEKRSQGARTVRLAKPLTSFSNLRKRVENRKKRKNFVFSLEFRVKGGSVK
jgi:hypothetical protein